MQALYISDGRLQYQPDFQKPAVGRGEALIRITLAGICATDLEIIKGYAGFTGVPGHEFVGVVEESDDPAWIGRRVVGTINLGCRTCAVCRTAGPEHCPKRIVLGIVNKDGVFAEYATLPVANLLEVPDGVSDTAAVFTEPLAAAVRILEQVRIEAFPRAAVVGPGRLGLLIAQVLKVAGATVTVLGRSARSLALPEKLGLTCGIVADYQDSSFDLVVEATGNQDGFGHSIRLVRPRGVLVLKSTFKGDCRLNLTKLVVDEITVVGSRCGPFGRALTLLEQGDIQVEPLIEKIYPLREGVEAFRQAAEPGMRKILLRP